MLIGCFLFSQKFTSF